MFFLSFSSIAEMEVLLRIVKVRMSIATTLPGILMLLESHQCHKCEYKGLNIQ